MLGPVPSIGSDTLPDVVKGRREAMKAMANACKKIAGMFEGKLPYDAPAFKRWADTIKAHSGAALMAEFPAASLGPPSGAKYEIDKSRDEFDALARKVASFASVISAAAEQAPDDITPQMRMGAGMSTIGSSLLGKRKIAAGEEDISKLPAEHAFHLLLQECSACHAKFREEIH
ncbi:cytochrome c [Phyllobacterium bourgognense]|nr:cytochrome c [Phyllobacterium bourgognense]